MLVVAELERLASERGYHRIYLTTGPRQPEAVALYLSAGYTPLYDPALPAEQVGVHPFEKLLRTAGPSSEVAVGTALTESSPAACALSSSGLWLAGVRRIAPVPVRAECR